MATMEVSAVQRYVRRAPRKARLVADSVKGMKVTEALAYLEFSPKHAARDVAKAIKSAAANAEHNFNLNHEVLAVQVEVVLGVCGRRLDGLGHVAGCVLRRELQVRESVRHLHAGDGVRNQPRFARRAAYESLNREYFHRRHLLLQCRGLLGVRAVTAEVPRRGELTEAMSDHVLADEHRYVLVSVMDGDGVPDHVGIDHRRTCPGADHLLVPGQIHLVDLAFQGVVDERPLLG